MDKWWKGISGFSCDVDRRRKAEHKSVLQVQLYSGCPEKVWSIFHQRITAGTALVIACYCIIIYSGYPTVSSQIINNISLSWQVLHQYGNRVTPSSLFLWESPILSLTCQPAKHRKLKQWTDERPNILVTAATVSSTNNKVFSYHSPALPQVCYSFIPSCVYRSAVAQESQSQLQRSHECV